MFETGVVRANECKSLRQVRRHNRDIFSIFFNMKVSPPKLGQLLPVIIDTVPTAQSYRHPNLLCKLNVVIHQIFTTEDTYAKYVISNLIIITG